MVATAAPFSGSSMLPVMEWWFALKRAPMTERITMAKQEITMLFVWADGLAHVLVWLFAFPGCLPACVRVRFPDGMAQWM